MVGKYKLRVENKKVRYDFTLDHKFTVVRGNSGTGKTYLRDIIQEVGTKITCSTRIVALNKSKLDYPSQLASITGVIFIVDEDVEGYTSDTFASLIQDSDNYFILFCRDKLSNLPISIDSIYELVSETYYNNINVPFTVTTLSSSYTDKETDIVLPDVLITEDKKSGFQFFNKTLNCDCISADGNSNIANTLLDCSNKYNSICIVIDRAAYGSFIYELFSTIDMIDSNVHILAPQSFEYLLLQAKIFKLDEKYLTEPYNYCSVDVFTREFPNFKLGDTKLQSWEQYFEALLRYYSSESLDVEVYEKAKLSNYYFRFRRRIYAL